MYGTCTQQPIWGWAGGGEGGSKMVLPYLLFFFLTTGSALCPVAYLGKGEQPPRGDFQGAHAMGLLCWILSPSLPLLLKLSAHGRQQQLFSLCQEHRKVRLSFLFHSIPPAVQQVAYAIPLAWELNDLTMPL